MHRLLRIFLLLFCLVPLTAMGQGISFEADAPTLVAAGKAFRVEFALMNARPDKFTPPDLSDFNIVAGPSTFEGESVVARGGNMVRNTNYTYTYVLRAPAEGKFTIGPATVTVAGKTYSTPALPIEVVKEEPAQVQQPAGSRQPSDPSATLADDDVLVRVIVNRDNVYRGQPVRVAFKLYYRQSIGRLEHTKIPTFNGFWTQELDVSQNRPQRENYNNKIYETVVFREFLLYPQQAGELTIDPYQVTASIQLVTQARRQSLLDDFFGGGPMIREVTKKLSSPPVKIQVNDLPQGAPESFSGAVGNFTMTYDLPPQRIPANSSATYNIKVSGTGNLPLIQSPRIDLPTSFEQYSVKTTESLNRSGNGISGYRQFEYPFIPRAEGTYMLEPVLFTYFNPETAKYVTLATSDLNLTVTADSIGVRSVPGAIVSGLTKEDIRLLDQDIRFIKIGNPLLRHNGKFLLGSPGYFFILLLILILFSLLFFFLKKRIKEMNDLQSLKEKRANRVALSRLRAAESHMKSGDQRGFNEEMLKALWGYMGDKLNIPVAHLTKESVRDELIKRSIPAEYINKYIQLITDCEYAQYSPAQPDAVPEIFKTALTTISKLESLIKK